MYYKHNKYNHEENVVIFLFKHLIILHAKAHTCSKAQWVFGKITSYECFCRLFWALCFVIWFFCVYLFSLSVFFHRFSMSIKIIIFEFKFSFLWFKKINSVNTWYKDCILKIINKIHRSLWQLSVSISIFEVVTETILIFPSNNIKCSNYKTNLSVEAYNLLFKINNLLAGTNNLLVKSNRNWMC